MIPRSSLRYPQRVVATACRACGRRSSTTAPWNIPSPSRRTSHPPSISALSAKSFHTSRIHQAQAPSADALMENLNDLYATAKDEFEIAAEETMKKTVYAADDREACHEAFQLFIEAYEKATKESGPEVAKEVQSRVGSRIREMETAIKNMDEMAMED